MIKKALKYILRQFNIVAVPRHLYKMYVNTEKDTKDLLNIPPEKLQKAITFLEKSKSQIKQDLFVLLELDFKKNGFFVEFGATNGVTLSNTYLLEKEFGWNGILAEPARSWHEDLQKNRHCNIETNCVWRDSVSSLNFSECEVKELSTISDYKSKDDHKKTRQNSVTYQVNTISLNDLLDKHKAPKIIDYLSIDTEGSEFEILSNFDFNRYSFRVITCEHAYTENREKIFNLLTKNGYVRKYTGFSKWDDWYVLAE